MSNDEVWQNGRNQTGAEDNKLLHYTMKQLVTISSGSILIMVAFLEVTVAAYRSSDRQILFATA
jgi:hypothetical protein